MKNRQVKSKIFHYDFFKKNHRGFLLAEETLKIIIALIAITFLVYFLASLYLKNQEGGELGLAKASLEKIISDADLGEVLIYNPSSSNKFPGGWVLISFPLNGERPNYCINLQLENCLCICNEAANTISDSGLAEDCDNHGICMESDLTTNDKIRLENPPIKLLIKDKVITNGA